MTNKREKSKDKSVSEFLEKARKRKRRKQSKEKRVDQDIRPLVLFKNYDYGGSEGGSDVSPGRGLYNGDMSEYKSVSEFLEKARKRKHRKKAFRRLLFNVIIAQLEND